LIASLGEDEERIADAQKAIQVQQIAIDRLEGELASKQSRLSQMSGFGGTQALPEGAQSTIGRNREQFIQEFTSVQGRPPSESEINRARGKYWE